MIGYQVVAVTGGSDLYGESPEAKRFVMQFDSALPANIH